ncbi:MAG: RrF2 family transcriptional regulator [Clostridiales bacterium]|nr:RrF2 family transcriptional regulator [Clostridiales bacterium]
MKISSKGRYALRMMIDIAEHGISDWVSIKDIARRQAISVKYLEQIVTNLTKSGLLRSSRGPQGGYMLTKPAEQYTIGEILRAIEGNLAPVACLEADVNPCERQDICPTLKFWTGLHHAVNNYVDSVTLDQLIDSCNTRDVLNFSI